MATSKKPPSPFLNKPPKDAATAAQLDAISAAYDVLYQQLSDLVMLSAEKTLALRDLQTSRFWAIAAQNEVRLPQR